MIVSKNHSFIFDLENVKETLGDDSLLHGTFLTASYASLAVLGIAFRSGRSSHFGKFAAFLSYFAVETWIKLDQIGSKWIKLVQT
jgi:hypothetical protein